MAYAQGLQLPPSCYNFSMNKNERIEGSKDFYCDEVLSGKTPIEMVHETERVLGFRHTNPAYATHIMVIPKLHINDLTTLEDESFILEVIGVIQKITSDVRREAGACRVISNLGSYQHNKHLHFHIISDPSIS